MRVRANQTHLASILEHNWHNRSETPMVTASPDLTKVIPRYLMRVFMGLLRSRKGLLRSKTMD